MAMRAIPPALTFSIEAELFRRFPELRVGVLVASRIDRAAASLTRLDVHSAWATAANALARSGLTYENVATCRPIQDWRAAFAANGVNASTHVSSVEAAVRQALASSHPAAIVPLVEICQTISACHRAPLAGFDLDTLPSPTVTLRTARPASDWFLPLGARPTDLPLAPSIVVYASSSTVLSWSFNHRASRQTCLHHGTRHAIFFSEAISTAHAPAVADALEHLRLFLIGRGADAAGPIFVDRAAPQRLLPAPANGRGMPGTKPRGETRQ
jgi:DNA/RNA-binding domain of Phe-tRNA-synthetase-like protein